MIQLPPDGKFRPADNLCRDARLPGKADGGKGCGGKENITSIDNCVTRLRLEVKDITAVNDKVIKSAGVAGVIKPGKTSVQVIIGTKVQFVADAFSKLCE